MDNTPLSPWSYFWLEILYSIPIVGLVFLIINAISAKNINKRNFARSYFCFVLIILIIVGIAAACGLFGAIFNR